MTRILVADDHAIVRDGLKRIIEATPDLRVESEATDGDDCLAQVRAREFDLVLLDMSMPGRSGIDLIRAIRVERPKLPVLVLSMHAEEQYAVRAIRAGASGYLTKESASSLLVAAARKIAGGGMYISPAVAEQMALSLGGGGHAGTELPHTTLSDRELEVFLALVRGEAVGEIASRLHISVKTVSTHKSRVLEKMGMTSLPELVRYAMTHKLVDDAAG